MLVPNTNTRALTYLLDSFPITALQLSPTQRAEAPELVRACSMVRPSNAAGSWTKPCTVPLSFSLRMRDRLCNLSSHAFTSSMPSRLPIPRARPVRPQSPPLALSPLQWPDAALLWLFMWHANFTFLHIPRTGGQSVERVDPRAPVSWFKALRLLDARRNASDPPSLTTQILTHGRYCHRALGSPWRFPPELLQHCEVPAAINPYSIHGTTVYCILREPFSRFVSIFLEAKRSPHWPHRTCDLAAPLPSQLECFAKHAARILQPLEIRRAYSDTTPPTPADKAHSSRAAAKQHVLTSELILSMLPQSHFVSTGRGEPTCDVVFQSDLHLRATGIPSIGSSSEALTITRLLQADLATKQLIKYVYRDDFTLWDRVQRGTTPTVKHASNLSAHFSRAARALPEFFARPPVCTPSDGCTCGPHCCDDALAAPDPCIQCVLAHAECGGPGVQAALQVPRAVAPVCKQVAMASEFPEHLHTCNTCEQCCNRPWVDLSGPSCFACEARSCMNDSLTAGSDSRRQHSHHTKHGNHGERSQSDHSHSKHGKNDHSHSKHGQ